MTAIAVINESGVECDTGSLARLADDCELCITIVDEPRMEELHIQWMDLPDATDVLSFPMDELRSAEPGQAPPSGILGDIVLCPEFARKQAAEAGRTLDEELQFLTTHGILHLLGHDHMTPEEYDVMFSLQDELLAKWNAS